MTAAPTFVPAWLFGPFALAAALLSSCASLPPVGPSSLPFADLDPQAIAYVRMNQAASLALLPELLAPALEGQETASKPQEAKLKESLSLVRRVESLELALLPEKTVDETLPRGGVLGLPGIEARANGNFPRLGLAWSLATSKDWKRESGSWKNKRLGFSLRLMEGELLLSSASLAALVDRRKAGLASPFPPRFSDDAGSGDFLVWLPDPLHRLSSQTGAAGRFMAGLELPLKDMLVRGRLAGAAKAGDGAEASASRFDLEIRFLMDSPDMARLYLPALRMGWTFLGPRLLLSKRTPVFTRQDDLVTLSGIEVDAGTIAELIRQLGRGEMSE